MKINLVKFRNGNYGVRRKHFIYGYQFLDFKGSGQFWWTRKDSYFFGCQTTKENAQARFDALTDNGEIVK